MTQMQQRLMNGIISGLVLSFGLLGLSPQSVACCLFKKSSRNTTKSQTVAMCKLKLEKVSTKTQKPG